MDATVKDFLNEIDEIAPLNDEDKKELENRKDNTIVED